MLNKTSAVRCSAAVVPHGVWDGVGPVREPGHALGERERGAFDVAEVGRLPPRADAPGPLVVLAGVLEFSGMSTHTLQPLIWLTRRWISLCGASGTVPDCAALLSASSAFIASGSTITG